MKTERCPSEVAEQIKAVVPDEYKPRFESLVRDFPYKAPEQMRGCWLRLSKVCVDLLNFPPFQEEWEIEMISLLTTKSKDELIAELEDDK